MVKEKGSDRCSYDIGARITECQKRRDYELVQDLLKLYTRLRVGE